MQCSTVDEHASSTIGVLAMQGAFREHRDKLLSMGHDAVLVRTLTDLDRVDAIVMPGGESTAIRYGLERAGMYRMLAERISDGMPVLATCAGLVVLGHAPADGAPPVLRLLDVSVSRNGYGRQVHSSEQDVRLTDPSQRVTRTTRGVFIRAPRIERVGTDVEPIGWIAAGEHEGDVVAVRSGSIIACCFHPELTADTTLHAAFLQLVSATQSAHVLPVDARAPHEHAGM